MNSGFKERFYFHADASALGGVVRQPVERAISSCASASLAQAGGSAHSRIERFGMDGVVSCESASVSIFGNYDAGHEAFRTLVTATVERVNILSVVSADRIVAQLSVAHPKDGGAVRVSLLGSQFVGLKIGGIAVNPKLRVDCVARRSYSDQQEGSHGDSVPAFADLLAIAEEQHRDALRFPSPGWLGTRLPNRDPGKDIEEKGSALCSAFHDITAEAPAMSYMHALHLPDFGNIFLGELLIGRSSYHLTMARVEMGCMGDGDISIGTAFSNGRLMP